MTWLEYLDTQRSRGDELGEVARAVITKFQGPEAKALGLTAETADFERLLFAIKIFIDTHFGEEMTQIAWQEYAAAVRNLN